MEKAEKQPEIPALDVSPLDGRVYAMPSYYLPKAKKSGMSQKQLLLIIIGVILTLIVVVFAVVLLRSNQSSQIATPTTPVQETPVTAPIDEEQEDEAEEELEPEEPEDEEEPIIEEVQDTPATTIELPPLVLSSVQPTTDTDQDGLTDPEEAIFLTNAAIPDTDQDSFLDGAELIGLYDPATPGALVEISPQVKVARNTARSYQLLIPSAWTASSIDPTGNQFTIRPDAGTETFTITMYENPDRMTPVQWYQAQDLSADLGQFNNFTNEAGWNGIRSQDGRVVISTFGSTGVGARAFIFVMHYDPGTDQLIQYPSIWSMILQSLSVLEPEPSSSSSSTSSQ